MRRIPALIRIPLRPDPARRGAAANKARPNKQRALTVRALTDTSHCPERFHFSKTIAASISSHNLML